MAVALVYFCMGLCFSSWASRIPDIKTALHLNDGMFGTILFALPAGQFLMMPFSGKLVTHFGSRKVLLFALPTYTIFLSNIGLVRQGWQVAIALFLFGLAGNLCNISIRTSDHGLISWGMEPCRIFRCSHRTAYDKSESSAILAFFNNYPDCLDNNRDQSSFSGQR